MSTVTASKRTTASTAKASKEKAAKAKAEASITATAAAIVAEGDTAEAKVTDAAAKASTPAEYLAAANVAATYVANAEADAFNAIVFGRVAVASAIYAAYFAATKVADANATPKAAEDLTWTNVANVALPATMNAKESYEKVTKESPRKRPIQRSWSALAEDWSLFTLAGHGGWRDAYDVARGDATPSVRDYISFCRSATAEAKRVAGEKGTKQAKGAATKAAAKAEADRQAEAAAKAKAERETAAKEKADKAITHATVHPSANVISGFSGLVGRDLTSCFDVAILDAVIHAVTAWRDHVKAMTADEIKAAKVAAGVEDVTAEAVADVAKADDVAEANAEADASGDDVAAIVAAVMAQMAAAK